MCATLGADRHAVCHGKPWWLSFVFVFLFNIMWVDCSWIIICTRECNKSEDYES